MILAFMMPATSMAWITLPPVDPIESRTVSVAEATVTPVSNHGPRLTPQCGAASRSIYGRPRFARVLSASPPREESFSGRAGAAPA